MAGRTLGWILCDYLLPTHQHHHHHHSQQQDRPASMAADRRQSSDTRYLSPLYHSTGRLSEASVTTAGTSTTPTRDSSSYRESHDSRRGDSPSRYLSHTSGTREKQQQGRSSHSVANGEGGKGVKGMLWRRTKVGVSLSLSSSLSSPSSPSPSPSPSS